ncbi:MAG: hypothetical protein ACK40G_13755 [Cytophagaceae bacterium]
MEMYRIDPEKAIKELQERIKLKRNLISQYEAVLKLEAAGFFVKIIYGKALSHLIELAKLQLPEQHKELINLENALKNLKGALLHIQCSRLLPPYEYWAFLFPNRCFKDQAIMMEAVTSIRKFTPIIFNN